MRREPVLQTWSGRLPLRRIDHIFTSAEFTVRGVYVPQTRISKVASDYLPLVVDFSCCLDSSSTTDDREASVVK